MTTATPMCAPMHSTFSLLVFARFSIFEMLSVWLGKFSFGHPQGKILLCGKNIYLLISILQEGVMHLGCVLDVVADYRGSIIADGLLLGGFKAALAKCKSDPTLSCVNWARHWEFKPAQTQSTSRTQQMEKAIDVKNLTTRRTKMLTTPFSVWRALPTSSDHHQNTF